MQGKMIGITTPEGCTGWVDTSLFDTSRYDVEEQVRDFCSAAEEMKYDPPVLNLGDGRYVRRRGSQVNWKAQRSGNMLVLFCYEKGGNKPFGGCIVDGPEEWQSAEWRYTYEPNGDVYELTPDGYKRHIAFIDTEGDIHEDGYRPHMRTRIRDDLLRQMVEYIEPEDWIVEWIRAVGKENLPRDLLNRYLRKWGITYEQV